MSDKFRLTGQVAPALRELLKPSPSIWSSSEALRGHSRPKKPARKFCKCDQSRKLGYEACQGQLTSAETVIRSCVVERAMILEPLLAS